MQVVEERRYCLLLLLIAVGGADVDRNALHSSSSPPVFRAAFFSVHDWTGQMGRQGLANVPYNILLQLAVEEPTSHSHYSHSLLYGSRE